MRDVLPLSLGDRTMARRGERGEKNGRRRCGEHKRERIFYGQYTVSYCPEIDNTN